MALDAKKVVALVLLLMPIGLGFLLSMLRPDLILPLARHPMGALVAAGVLALTLAGAGLALLGLWMIQRWTPPGEKWLRRFLAAIATGVPFVFFTLPAVVMLLFSPILFAFMTTDGAPAGAETRDAVQPLLPVIP